MAVKNKLPVVWSISLRTIRGEHVLYTTINYSDRLISEIKNELLGHYRNTHNGAEPPLLYAQRIDNAYKHYESSHTNGMTPKEFAQEVKRLGYSPKTHILLGWYTTMDYILFDRLLNDPSHAPMATKPKNRCLLSNVVSHYVNVSKTCSMLIPLRYRCQRLGSIARMLFPDEEITFHHAHEDTRAMAMVIRLMVQLLPAAV